MATTTYFDATFATRAINARTNSAGGAVTDLTAEEDRLSHEFATEGWLVRSLSFVPTEGEVATMNLAIGSEGARTDYYMVPGDAEGQGKYVVRLAGKVNVLIDNASPSLARKDEVYLVVEDHAYDGNSRSLARLGYRTGTPAITPLAPGPDSGWNAASLIATIDVPAGTPDIQAATITDERNQSQLIVDAATLDGHNAAYFSLAGHIHESGPTDYTDIAHEGATTGHPEATTSDSGLMDSADKSKLDGIEDGADVNPSASEALAQIKNEDGAGSGLDADKLDGTHGSGLSASGHNHDASHFTESETDAQLATKRNKVEGTFMSAGSFAGTFTSGALAIVPIMVIERDDWGVAPTLPSPPGAASAQVDVPTNGGTYLVYGQVAFAAHSTGFRQAQIQNLATAVLGVQRQKAISGDVSIVNVSAVYTSTGGSDEVRLYLYHTAGTAIAVTSDTWIRVIALDH